VQDWYNALPDSKNPAWAGVVKENMKIREAVAHKPVTLANLMTSPLGIEIPQNSSPSRHFLTSSPQTHNAKVPYPDIRRLWVDGQQTARII
jgi:hypothetical protein